MNENNNNGAIFKPAKPVFHAGSIHITNYNQRFGGVDTFITVVSKRYGSVFNTVCRTVYSCLRTN